MSKKLTTRLKCPKELTERAEKATWRSIIGAYAADYFNSGDVGLLMNFCRAKVMCDQSRQIVAEEGLVIEGPRGPIQHPAFKTWRDTSASMASIATKLRMSPSGRARPEDGQISTKRAKEGKTFDPTTNWRDMQSDSLVN